MQDTEQEYDSSNTRKCSLAMFCGRTSLFVLMTGYALFGALLFKFLESGVENHQVADFQRSREDCLKELWIITERLNVLYEKNWTRLVTEQLKKFERSVVETAKNDENFNLAGPKWTFGGSLLYTVTLLTTVGYGRLSPKTALGKIIAIIYAIIGVPLMLVLLSELGSVLAYGVRRGYSKLCCHKNEEPFTCPSVGYHKAPSSPTKNYYCKSKEDTASIQLTTTHSTPNHVTFQTNHINHYVNRQEVPKRVILATVRASHSRGRCRQAPVRQILADPNCPTHCHSHGSPLRNSSIVGISTDIELEEVEENDENGQGQCLPHDTPSRIPLIWGPPDKNGGTPHSGEEATPSNLPSVPIFLVVFLFFSYIGLGAACFANMDTWTFLDAIYFCFLALSTIGVGDKLPTIHQNEFGGQLHVFACCLYIFLGLVILAMCFSLVQEELTIKCRQLANSLGFGKE
ncbi:potassium channel subfamily K member 18-like [Euwallacea fornicatus]|uniref:potassium channel subfamily K member 18-like n=1 Tax=Euwallacea fornicatus TaxID=995702 RepID=UPI00338D790B